MAYGAARVGVYRKNPPPPENRSADDYLLEYAAREVQSAFWEKRRQEGAPAYPMLDRQVEIWRSGFLPELLISIHAHVGWTIPGPTVGALRLEAFAKQFPGDYDATLAVAVVSPAGFKFPTPPGGDFPDPAQLPLGATSCGLMRGEREASWRRWSVLAPRLGGAPLAAQNAQQLAAILNRVHTDPTYAGRGVTWVSWRVGHLAFLEGFCAMEEHDWPRAVELLSRSVSLTPTDVQSRLELGMALGMVKRFDEALAQDRFVMERSKDGCVVATALRHLGYTYFDMGLLEAARLSYEKSLDYDPANPLAKKELKNIAGALTTRHDDPKNAAAFVPPPLGSVTVSKCEVQRTGI